MLDFSFAELFSFILTAMGIIVAYLTKSELCEFILKILDMILTHSNKRKGIDKHDRIQKK